MKQPFVSKEQYDRDMKELHADVLELKELVKPMAEVFNGSRFSWNLFWTILQFIGLLATAVAGMVYLFKRQ